MLGGAAVPKCPFIPLVCGRLMSGEPSDLCCSIRSASRLLGSSRSGGSSMYWKAAALKTPFALGLGLTARGATVSFVNMLIYSDAARSGGSSNMVAQFIRRRTGTTLIHEIRIGNPEEYQLQRERHPQATMS